MQYRFTQMAANVMHYSKEVAAELNHSYIGTEHILIGLLREKEGLACQVLEDHDVTEEKVLHMVTFALPDSFFEPILSTSFSYSNQRMSRCVSHPFIQKAGIATRHRPFEITLSLWN